MISLLMPTRGRPESARRFLDSVASCSSRLDSVEVVLYVDDDDRGSHDLDHDRVRVVRVVGPAVTMGDYNSGCLARASGSIVMLVNDDVVIRTRGWDERVLALDAEFSDGVYLAYPNDLFKGRRVATFPILSRKTCDLLVTPYPAEYRGGLIDYHLLDIFKRLVRLDHDRIRYLDDVVFEHRHYRTGKSELDATYLRRDRFGDDEVFIALRGLRQASAVRLAARIDRRTLPDLPPGSARRDATRAVNFAGAVRNYGQVFLRDAGLPLAWRLFLFTWYCGRDLATRRRGVQHG